METYTYPALFAEQGKKKCVFVFCAPAKEILAFAAIDRIGRNADGTLKGFQRHQVASHINEISEYLQRDDAVLPNSVVVAFVDRIQVDAKPGQVGNVHIEMGHETPPGLVVDGQQRLSALAQTSKSDFQVFVSGILCEDSEELRKQFILINNTKPLPKALIYELLPTVDGLPHRLSSRSSAASLVERLNYEDGSSLKGQIRQHTNPTGVIQDTMIQKVIMNSLADGILRRCTAREDGQMEAFRLLSEFFAAVQQIFPEAWVGHRPRTSRLVHGAGIVGMGYVMEHLCATEGATTKSEFSDGMQPLKPLTHWTDGAWEFGRDNVRPWNSLQFVRRDYMELSQYLVRILRQAQRQKQGRLLSVLGSKA